MHAIIRWLLAAGWGLAIVLAWTPTGAQAANAFDWGPWGKILEARVAPVTIAGIRLSGVDYAGLRKDRAGFDRLVRGLKSYDPSDLKGKSKLAFWINVYNLGAVRHGIDNPGIASLNEVGPEKGAVWKLPVLDVGGRAYSLDDIENRILRKLGEPRIHFAIVCASVSCPDLRAEVYTPARLDRQLDAQSRAFLAEAGKGVAVDAGKRTLRVTKLFEWFAGDFGGPAGVKAFIAKHLDAKQLPSDWIDFQLSYLDYDWRLNAR